MNIMKICLKNSVRRYYQDNGPKSAIQSEIDIPGFTKKKWKDIGNI